jgi:site-specific DNA-methyltransferase (adenine-specific)
MFARRRLNNPDWTFCGNELSNGPDQVTAPPLPAPPVIHPYPFHNSILGDCLPIEKAMPTESVDTVIGSLPFPQCRGYNGLGVGREATLAEYLAATLPILEESLRVSKGTVCFNLGDRREKGSQLLLPAQFALAAIQRIPGIILVNDVKAFREQIRPDSGDRKHLTIADQSWLIFAKPHSDYYWNPTEWNLRPPRPPLRHSPRLGEGYRRTIMQTDHLNDVEKRNALTALDTAIATVGAGHARELRMILRGHHALPFGGESSNQSQAVERDGFYVFLIKGEQSRTNLIVHANESRIGNRHPAIFPEFVVTQFIKLLCPPNGLVLDPFAGSGTTITAAQKCGRSCLGIEIDPSYHASALERLQEGA